MSDEIDLDAAREANRALKADQLLMERLIAEGKLSPDALPEGARPQSAETVNAMAAEAKRGRKPKGLPIVPIPEAAKKSLNAEILSTATINRHGGSIACYRYFSTEGWASGVVLYEKNNEREYVSYFFGEDAKWHEGQPYDKNRPLYNLPTILCDRESPILIVADEECASVQVPGYILTTWGATSTIAKTDLSPLLERDVIFWPTHELEKWGPKELAKSTPYGQVPGDVKAKEAQAGYLDALALKKKLSKLQALDVWAMGEADEKDKWSIVQCIAEGFDATTFINEAPRIESDKPREPIDIPDEGAPPFECIGYDKGSYWFLKGEQRILSKIDMGHFTASLLGELAPPEWWAKRGAITDKGGIDVCPAQQIIIERETKRGFFRPEILRGSGVWLENGEPVINDGDNIITLGGTKTPVENYSSNNAYVRSQLRFDDMTGEESTPEEGRALCELIKAQCFVSERAGVAMLGWSLIAPFGGVLPWRPMVWLTGKTANGKSWFLDNVVVQLCGHFHFKGTKRTSEASTRRATNMIACPVILDEMTPKNKDDKDKIGKQIELAKNSSGDSSGTSALASGVDSYVLFVNRSPFCFAGVNVPEAGAEIANRFVVCELKTMAGAAAMEKKITESSKLYGEAMGDPARYRRRIFRALPRILQDIDTLRGFLPRYVGGQRMADVWAPLIAAAWAVQSDESIEASMEAWLLPLLAEVVTAGSPYIEDEDRVIEHILSAVVMSDDKKSKSVAEWLLESQKSTTETDPFAAEDLLSRVGIRVVTIKGRKLLAIATASDALARLLKDTPYEAGYDAQIRRNALCLNTEKPNREWMAGRCVSARLLDWAEFKRVYMEEGYQ